MDEDEGVTQTKKVSKQLKDDCDNKAIVVAVGTLAGKGGYGHMNGYQYQFIVKCLEKAKPIHANVP
jgi:Ni,Fe-hydrogenase III small subunit